MTTATIKAINASALIQLTRAGARLGTDETAIASPDFEMLRMTSTSLGESREMIHRHEVPSHSQTGASVVVRGHAATPMPLEHSEADNAVQFCIGMLHPWVHGSTWRKPPPTRSEFFGCVVDAVHVQLDGGGLP